MNSSAGNFDTKSVMPTITVGAYTAGFQLGGLQTLPQASLGNGLACKLHNLIITDSAKQNAATVVFFFHTPPVIISSDYQALNISHSEMRDKCVGFVSVGTSDWVSLSNNGVATIKPELAMCAVAGNGTLYAVAMTSGTPTYTSTGDLTFKYVFSKEF